jgi:hypothetical protein
LLDGLAAALAEPEGAPLLRSRAVRGLFAPTKLGRLAAQHATERGYLQPSRSAARTKHTHDSYTITEAGLTYLTSALDPRDVVEKLGQALATCGQQLDAFTLAAQQCRQSLDLLRGHVQTALTRVRENAVPKLAHSQRPSANGSSDHATSKDSTDAALTYLRQWQSDRPQEDCPLPCLHREVRRYIPLLTIGQFHDGLRELQAKARVYLHPWTGPLFEIPEPALALLVGHAIVYFASLRDQEP